MIPLLLLASTTRAQSNSSINCGAGDVFPSAQRDLMLRAATDNTNLYGAVGTAERVVLPLMHEHEGMKMLVMESHMLAGALHVPARAIGDCEDALIRAPVDLTAGNWALAWAIEDFGLFYNASVTTAYPHGAGGQRAVIDTVNTLSAIYYGLAAPYQGHDVSPWYPGDVYVAGVAISVFGHMYGGPELGPDGDAVLDLAREQGKPVMVAESSAVQGIDPDDPGAWDDWFVPFFTFVCRNDVRAIAFINEDWTTLDFPDVQWEDARLPTNPDVAEAFWLETAGDRWLHASPELWGEIGYPAR